MRERQKKKETSLFSGTFLIRACNKKIYKDIKITSVHMCQRIREIVGKIRVLCFNGKDIECVFTV